MLEELRRKAGTVNMRILQSGEYFLVYDRWGEWRYIGDNPLLTIEQVRELVEQEIKTWQDTKGGK